MPVSPALARRGGDQRLAADAEVVDARRSRTQQFVQLRGPTLDRGLLQPGAWQVAATGGGGAPADGPASEKAAAVCSAAKGAD